MVFIKKNFITQISILFLTVFFLSSCFQSLSPRGENGSVVLKIAVPSFQSVTEPISGARFIHPDTKKLVLTVSGKDIESITEIKTLVSGESEIIIEVNTIPSGSNRTIEVSLYNGDDVLVAKGSTTVHIQSNAKKPISITAIPVNAITLEIGVASAAISSSMSGKTIVYAVSVVAPGTHAVSSATGVRFNMFDSAGKKVPPTEEGGATFYLSAGINFLTATMPTNYANESATVTLTSIGFEHGLGTKASPYQVASAEDLNRVRSALKAHFIQTKNITLTGEWTPIGTNLASFEGTYNGNGKYITGLTITDTTIATLNGESVGLFGFTYGATLQGIGLIGVNIETTNIIPQTLGALVGFAMNTTIDLCFSNGSIDGTGAKNVGGLVGTLSSNSTISQSWSTASVSGEQYVGGFIGNSNYSSISNCYATGSVSSNESDNAESIAGFVGYPVNGSITNCFATGSLSNDSFQGFAGGPHNIFTSCYWDMTASGSNDSSGGGNGINTTAAMKTRSTFIDWDLDTIWFIKEGEANFYPSLSPFAAEVDFSTHKEYYISGGTVSFGTSLEDPESLTFTIYNNGITLFTPIVTLSNANPGRYSISPPFVPVSIPAGSISEPFIITLEGAKGDPTREATLIISDGDPDTPDLILLLTGSFSA